MAGNRAYFFNRLSLALFYTETKLYYIFNHRDDFTTYQETYFMYASNFPPPHQHGVHGQYVG